MPIPMAQRWAEALVQPMPRVAAGEAAAQDYDCNAERGLEYVVLCVHRRVRVLMAGLRIHRFWRDVCCDPSYAHARARLAGGIFDSSPSIPEQRAAQAKAKVKAKAEAETKAEADETKATEVANAAQAEAQAKGRASAHADGGAACAEVQRCNRGVPQDGASTGAGTRWWPPSERGGK